jgi:polysaccharide export outer membrane protein
MMLTSRTLCATIGVSLLLTGHICLGQTRPGAQPPASETATAASVPDPAREAPPKEAPPKEVASKDTPAAPKGGAVAGSPVPSTPKSKAYVFGPLDELEIRVYKAPNLSGFYPISADGYISVLLLGQIKAAGMTPDQLTATLRELLAEKVFSETPDLSEVNVQLVRNNSKKYFVYGAVTKPGEFPLNGDVTVLDALALVLPFKEFAKVKSITIQRGGKMLNFNYNEVRHGKKLDQNIQLQNGDRIFVDGDN